MTKKKATVRVTELTSFKELKKFINDAGYSLVGPRRSVNIDKYPYYKTVDSEIKSAKDFGDYYSGGCSFSIKTPTTPGFYFNCSQSKYSCAVPNIGSFSRCNLDPELMAALLKMACLNNERQGYLQGITTTQSTYSKLNKAFTMAGFLEVARMKTRHAAKYSVIVWEWVAPKKEKK